MGDRFSLNKALQQREYEEGKVVLSSYPTILNLPVADRCNLRCFMCAISVTPDFYKIHISPESYKKIEILYPYLETLELEGAEVFTAKDGAGEIVDEIISAAADYPDMKLAALTNGQLISAKRAEKIVDRFGVLNISIDSPDPSIYESIRVGGKLETLISNIRRINAVKKERGLTIHDAPRLQFSAIVMKRTYKDLAQLVDLIADLGGVYFSFQPLRQEVPDEFYGPFADEDIFANRDALAEYLNILEEVKARAAKTGIRLLDRTQTYVAKHHPDLAAARKSTDLTNKIDTTKKGISSPQKRTVCRFPWRNLFIRPNGDVAFSCCSKKIIGNINSQSIPEIWNGAQAVDERIRFLQGNYENCNINCQMGYSFAGTKLTPSLNICLISQEYPPDTNWGGIATYTQVLARQLVKMGQKVAVICLAEQEEYTTDDMGVTVHRISRRPHTPIRTENLDDLEHEVLKFSQRVYEKVQELHVQQPFDVIEAPETCAQALLVFKHLTGVVKITRLHTPFFWVRELNNMPETPQHLVRDQLEEMQIGYSTVVTSPTHAMAQVVQAKWGTADIKVVPNFFNLKSYQPDNELYDKHLKQKDYLLFFGRLEYRKGAHVLAEALPDILSEQKNLSVVFIGSDSIYNSMSMKALMLQKLKGYEERVQFIENIPHASLYPIIEKAKLVVLPSLWENFPYVCLEAMSLGKAVVASSSGGFPEIIESGKEGILCAPGDTGALKNAIGTALAETDLDALGRNAKTKAGTFDTETVVEVMLDLYTFSVATRLDAGSERIGYVLRHIPVPSETFVINEIIAMQHLGLAIYPISLLPAQRCHEALMAQVTQEVLDLSDKKRLSDAESSSGYEKAALLAKELKIAPVLAAQAALVADFVKENGLTHLHAHFATESAWVAMIASKISGVPFTFTAHAYDIFMRDKRIINEDSLEERLKILVAEAAGTFTISDHNKEYIVSHTSGSFAEKISIVHCGIDPARFQFHPRDRKSGTTFLSVGRFVEKKGFDYLVRAFRLVCNNCENAALRIVGEGHLQESVIALVNELGLGDKVTFLGAVSTEVVVQEMQQADVFVLHSVTAQNGDKEGIPVSIMEACATGLPVISTNHSGISELVIDGVSGFLSEERDVEAFANYMIALAASPELRCIMGKAGRNHVERNFNQRVEAEKLAGLLRRNTATQKEPAEERVDIIMPTYTPNLVYLKRAILSIIGQSFSNWILYLVQDGNDCDVKSVLEEVGDCRIRYYERPHQGKPEALNFALSQGDSKYVAYLDDDDIWYPNHLEETIGYMRKTGAQFVHTDSHEIFISTEGGRFEEISRRSLNKGVITNKTLWYISHINAVHERHLLEKSGKYDPAMPFFIDWDMFQRLAKHAKPHHLNVYTCEHYMYLNKEKKESNTISSAHKKDPDLSRRMHVEMFKRSFELISPSDFAEVVADLQSKNSQLEELRAELTEKQAPLQELAKLSGELAEKDAIIKDRDQKIEALLNSLSWKVSAPLRWGYEKILKLR